MHLDRIDEESNYNLDESSLLGQSMKNQEWKRYSMDQHYSLSPPQSLRQSRN